MESREKVVWLRRVVLLEKRRKLAMSLALGV